MLIFVACQDTTTFGTSQLGPDPTIVTPEGFMRGVNYPWANYGHDFGRVDAWGHDGLSMATTRDQADRDLRLLAESGVEVLRWFVFGDGRAAPEFGSDGLVSGFDDVFFDDIDVMLNLLDTHDLYVMPVLFDYLWFEAAQEVEGATLGGHGPAILDKPGQQALLTHAIAPLAAHLADEPRIVAWDIINEPEWAMQVVGGGITDEAITSQQMKDLVEAVRLTLDGTTDQPITLGSADPLWMESLWTDADLDFLQFHYYSDVPLTWEVGDFSTESPILVGEFPTANTGLEMTSTMTHAESAGFTGAFPWSLNGEDDASALDTDAYRLWTQ